MASNTIEIIISAKDVTGRALKAVGRGLTDLTKFAVKAGIAIGALSAVTLKAFASFEDAFAGVRKTVEATEDQFSQLSDSIRAMAKEIPASVVEISNVAEAAGQLGIAAEDIIDFTRTMIDLGNTTNLSSTEAATALARLANITQLPSDQFDELGSTIVALGNNFATTEREIVDLTLRIAGAGNIIGITEGQMLAFATR
jgi:TP901 family phage tail tape measure protein